MTIFVLMKRIIITLVPVLLSLAAFAKDEEKKPSFAYALDLNTYFDNRESDNQGNLFTPSMTIFGARVTPELGLAVGKEETHHNIMIGASLFKDFGSQKTKGQLFENFTFYYNLEKKLSEKTHLGITAGVFPRTKGRGNYSEAFFSDSLKFYDPNYEGLLFRFDKPKAYYELGVDWIGMKGPGSRERFMIFSAGQGKVVRSLKLAYSAYMYHFASSEEVSGVVDNILLNPYILFDATEFPALEKMQKMNLSLGYLQSAQRDRVNSDSFKLPFGFELVANVRRWNVGIENRFYGGRGLMPYYNSCDDGGFKYGNQLYFGSPYYRVRSNDESGLYDRAEIYWEPKIAKGLYFKIAAIFHFNSGVGFSGSQQIIALRYNLGRL